MADFEVQTRNDDGELNQWPSIAIAFVAATQDRTIWKISWTNKETDERVRLVRTNFTQKGTAHKTSLWVYEPIELPSSERR